MRFLQLIRCTSTVSAMVGAVLALSAPAIVIAQVTKPIAFGVSAGFSNPIGDFATSYNSGSHVTASVFVQEKSMLSFRVDGMFNEFSSSSTVNGITRVWAVTGNTILSARNHEGPFLTGGLGAYNVVHPPDIGGGNTMDVGYSFGGGFRFALSGFDGFAQVQLHQAGDKAVRFVPITFGVVF